MMRASIATALLLATTLLVLVALPATAQEPSHGGSLTNTRNHLYVVQADADNPQGIDAGYGALFVRETVSFTNDDPLKVPGYGVVYVDPTYQLDPGTPIIASYRHEYTIANFTLQLYHEEDDWLGNLTGYTTTSATLRSGLELGPEGPEEPHPKVNTTYTWLVWAVSEQNRQLFSATGGEVTTEVFNDTVLDWSTLDVPGIGPHTYEAELADRVQLTLRSVLEDHPSLSDGWYRFRISDQGFEYGVSLSIELRYSGVMQGDRAVLDKFIFTGRTIDLEVYHKGAYEVIMTTDVDGKGSQVPPVHASTGAGDPTEFTYDDTFSLVIEEPGKEGTDWGLYGRYALLAVLIGVLLALVLWGGRDKGAGTTEEEEEEDEVEDPEVAARRAQLEQRRDAILAEIKDLDRRHDQGNLGDGVWRRKRRSLKNRAVEVMREIDDLGTGGGAGGGGGAGPGGDADGTAGEGDDVSREVRDLRELEREKDRVLQLIREIDGLHDDGELDDTDWKRHRKALKAEAVEIIRDIEELEEG